MYEFGYRRYFAKATSIISFGIPGSSQGLHLGCSQHLVDMIWNFSCMHCNMPIVPWGWGLASAPAPIAIRVTASGWLISMSLCASPIQSPWIWLISWKCSAMAGIVDQDSTKLAIDIGYTHHRKCYIHWSPGVLRFLQTWPALVPRRPMMVFSFQSFNNFSLAFGIAGLHTGWYAPIDSNQAMNHYTYLALLYCSMLRRFPTSVLHEVMRRDA